MAWDRMSIRLAAVSHRPREKFAIDFLRANPVHEGERRTSRHKVSDRVADTSGRSDTGNVPRRIVASFCRHSRNRRCDRGGRTMN
jgi:hypothetical protein